MGLWVDKVSQPGLHITWVTCSGVKIMCHYVMIEADSHLKLLPPSILDIYKVFEHIDMITIGIW